MTLTVHTLNGEADAEKRWDAFVENCLTATFFHLSGWRRVIEEAFSQRCHFLHAVDAEGRVRGVLPLVHVRSPIFGNRLVSTGWCVGGGAAVEDDEALRALDEAADELLGRTKAEYIEIRDPAHPHGDGAGWVKRDGLYATFERPIPATAEDALKAIPRKQRAVVRKALDSDLEARIDQDAEVFYRLYALSMRNLGTPVFARSFFEALMHEFGERCDILTVYRGSQALSSVLSFYFRGRVMPYYTGADPEARRLGAADLMYFRLMCRAAEEKACTVFDFGRSKVGTGPYSFKKNWGFEPRPLFHEFRMANGGPLPDVNPNNPKYRGMIAVWKRLPLPVANAMGPWIGRQVG